MMLTANPLRSLPDFFTDLPDPRRAQGRRHRWATVLALAAGAVLCGRRGYQALAQGAQRLGPKARQRFRCRHYDGQHWVPSESIRREVLLRVDPVHLDRARQAWHATDGQDDESLAIDGKTLRQGRPTHLMGVVGHHTQICYTPKKSVPGRSTAMSKSSKPKPSKGPSPCCTPSTSPRKTSPPRPC